MSSLRSVRCVSGQSRSRRRVHLDAADRRQIIALAVEEQAVEQGARRFRRRRLAGTHDAVDVHQRAVALGVLVDVEGVAHEGARRDMIDVEDREFLELAAVDLGDQLGVDLLAGLTVDLAGLEVDDILGEIAAIQLLFADQDLLDAVLGQLAGDARGQLFAGLDDHFAGLGVDQVVVRLHAAHALGIVGHLPAGLGRLDGDLLVERVEDLLLVQAERIQQRRRRQLALAVDAHVDDVLGVELEVEPRAAIGNDAGGEQQLARRMRAAAVVVEEHARRAVHLRDDHALGAVDDEGAVHRHEGHVAHVDVLLLDVLDGLGAGLLVHIEHDQAQLDLERRRVTSCRAAGTRRCRTSAARSRSARTRASRGPRNRRSETPS